jgi:hypothetical protein
MIKLKYLAHSSFLVECGETKLLFDPWLKGPAYMKQWYLWPLPPEGSENIKADVILISHGHEDHFHPETLKSLDKSAHVFFPFQWKSGIKPYLNELGYNEVTEAVALKTYMVNDIEISFIGYSLESVIVIKYKNEVLVNINDALNSNHENAADFIMKEIKTKWPKIDYIISGWSGASYFPNQVKYPGKNDIEIGKLREQYFANNFFRFTNYLQPKYAISVPPGFLLLKKNTRWINHVKFPRTKLDSYYRMYFENTDATAFFTPFPDDTIENGQMNKKSVLHDLNEAEQYDIAYRHYEKEMEEADKTEYVSEADIAALVTQLTSWMNYNKMLYHPIIRKDCLFSIKLEDAEEEAFLNINFTENKFAIMRSNKPLEDRRLLITTSAKKLLVSLQRVWGGDILTIGYGITVEAYDLLTLEKNLDIVCMRLITRYPIAKKDMPKEPFRVLRFYAQNPKITTFWLKQKMILKPYVNKYPFNERDHWLTYNKCNLCAVCKMPEINLEAYA